MKLTGYGASRVRNATLGSLPLGLLAPMYLCNTTQNGVHVMRDNHKKIGLMRC